jgi:hypothetical protein
VLFIALLSCIRDYGLGMQGSFVLKIVKNYNNLHNLYCDHMFSNDPNWDANESKAEAGRSHGTLVMAG